METKIGRDLGPTLDEQIKEVERELALRRNVFPRLVAGGRMKQDYADICMERMLAVLSTLKAVLAAQAQGQTPYQSPEPMPAKDQSPGPEQKDPGR